MYLMLLGLAILASSTCAEKQIEDVATRRYSVFVTKEAQSQSTTVLSPLSQVLIPRSKSVSSGAYIKIFATVLIVTGTALVILCR